MSCQSCSGCFTNNSCSTKVTVKEKTRFQDLLNAASNSSHDDHLIPTIVVELSKNVYASHNVLIKAFDTLGLSAFLELSRVLYQLKLTGEHIAWADEYCQSNLDLLMHTLQTDKQKLLAYCDDQAELHELFRSLAPHTIPRVSQ
ncbi:hypothetical protein G6F56_001355 [Rhizopus delemar]|uniref:Uncharacterized protein n=1 Tax=Rhizopus stolonifer TaxID=4846 RepID=A0A367KYG8_RHIST|nr:hypothetical protein G6F56_001355 [Rhizopus delemar]RCI07177.1 hypothetical protein CU098_013774 [Rhizopus stolonifer]